MDTSESVRLSRRETQVLGLLCTGLIDKEVAERLGVSLGTIRVYRKRTQAKLGTQGLVQSALVAWRLGQLDLEAIADETMARRSDGTKQRKAGSVPSTPESLSLTNVAIDR